MCLCLLTFAYGLPLLVVFIILLLVCCFVRVDALAAGVLLCESASDDIPGDAFVDELGGGV